MATSPSYFADPPVARFLFGDIRMASFWLLVRIYVGWTWLDAGWHKVQDPRWVQTGEAILGYWKGAVAIPAAGSPRITFDWYRNLLQLLIDTNSHTWFGKLIAFGETAVGIALILGAFVGIAAFFGATMNFAFLLAGSTSSNPLLFLLAILLMLAWKTAGYYGLDRWLLPLLGTPWQPIPALRRSEPTASPP
ncbi:MAG TPA: DoxX family membrane protein [Candidatus Limnocylindria bacterium]|nr:DoxX family membrane protein [Candidatus Limnocylindria bacterium]